MIRVVAVDPGHGGQDSGCFYGGVKESDIAWRISGRLKAQLEYHEIEVILTRNEDEDPSHSVRNRRAQDHHATLVVSVHANAAANPQAHGLIAFHWPENAEMASMAKIIQRAAPYELYRGVAPTAALPSNYPRVRNVLEAFTAPAVLVECGFLTNPKNLSALCDDGCQQRIAMAIALGVLSYGGKSWTEQRP